METNGTQTFIKATSARRLHLTSFASIDRSPLQGGDYHNIDPGHDDHRDVGETQIPTALIEKHTLVIASHSFSLSNCPHCLIQSKYCCSKGGKHPGHHLGRQPHSPQGKG